MLFVCLFYNGGLLQVEESSTSVSRRTVVPVYRGQLLRLPGIFRLKDGRGSSSFNIDSCIHVAVFVT